MSIKQELIINSEENHYTKVDFVNTRFHEHDTFKDYLVIKHQGMEIFVEMNRYQAKDVFEELQNKLFERGVY